MKQQQHDIKWRARKKIRVPSGTRIFFRALHKINLKIIFWYVFTNKIVVKAQTRHLARTRAPLTLSHGSFFTKKVLQNPSLAPIYYRGILLKRFRY